MDNEKPKNTLNIGGGVPLLFGIAGSLLPLYHYITLAVIVGLWCFYCYSVAHSLTKTKNPNDGKVLAKILLLLSFVILSSTLTGYLTGLWFFHR